MQGLGGVILQRGRRGRTPSPCSAWPISLPASRHFAFQGAFGRQSRPQSRPAGGEAEVGRRRIPCRAEPRVGQTAPTGAGQGRECLSGRVNPTTTPLRGAVPLPLQGRFGRCAPSNAALRAASGDPKYSGWCNGWLLSVRSIRFIAIQSGQHSLTPPQAAFEAGSAGRTSPARGGGPCPQGMVVGLTRADAHLVCPDKSRRRRLPRPRLRPAGEAPVRQRAFLYSTTQYSRYFGVPISLLRF